MMDDVDSQVVILLCAVREALVLLKRKQYDRAEWLLEYGLTLIAEQCGDDEA